MGTLVWGCGETDPPVHGGYTGGDSSSADGAGGDFVSGDVRGDPGGGDTFMGDHHIGGDSTSPIDCDVTICLGGALFRNTGANPTYVQPLCELLPGIVYDTTDNQYSFFMYSNSAGALAALIDALDTNNDGFVDESDDRCRVNIVGYSWGGVNAAHKLAPDFMGHANVSVERAIVDNLLIMAPYAPSVSPIHVPSDVRRFREYRHSSTPASDCSIGVPLGPYLGIPPECPTGADCIDYDYALEPDSLFVGLVDDWYGDEVGHCTIVDVAAPAVMYELGVTQTVPALPPTVPVDVY
ncbi:MAG: hypothetical protein A2341_20475 [Deltaproteobacteria bacterium RIFOXYB12_FULL_58_9]|nr:MAG: hypothetical protein A2341_20475 [Deltaproteobacteria bacterium RIFOXYB12_FULL_58_9]